MLVGKFAQIIHPEIMITLRVVALYHLLAGAPLGSEVKSDVL